MSVVLTSFPQVETEWTTVRLADVCQINPGKPKSDALPADSPVTFVPMAAIDEVTGSITKPVERPFAKVRGSYTPFQNGDVLFAKITPCMENGKAAIARDLTNGLGFGSSEFHVIRPSSQVLSEFIYQYVRQKSFRNEAKENMTGSVGQARVPADWLKDVELALPSIEEQREIVAHVELLQRKVESARDIITGVPTSLRKFRQSVLAAACSGQLTADWRDQNPAIETASSLLMRIRDGRHPKDVTVIAEREDEPTNWARTRIGQICQVATGATPLRRRSDYYDGTIPWVTSSAVNQNLVTKADECISELAIKDTNAKVFPKGTLLVAMYGEGQTRGRVAELGIDAATNQALAALLFSGANADCKDFLRLHFLRNYEEMRELAAGGVQPNLSLGLIRDSVILLPPLEEQAEIVRRVSELFSLAESVESRLVDATALVERTTQAILAKAFRGELIPTGDSP